MSSTAAIAQSPAFRNWRSAFRVLAGINLHLLDGAFLEASLRQAANETSLCSRLCQRCERCAACRRKFCRRLHSAGANHAGPFAMRCFAGLTVTALPVRQADETTAFLYTDPVILSAGGTAATPEGVADRVVSENVGISRAAARNLVRRIPVRKKPEFNAAITLMRLLAEQLAHESRRMLEVPDRGTHESYVIRRATELVDRHYTENLHIDQVAHEIGVSRSYISHLFRRILGLTFTNYLAERRVIEVKRLLIDTGLPVTEILFAAGFQSVSQANRVFRSATGMSPCEFRRRA